MTNFKQMIQSKVTVLSETDWEIYQYLSSRRDAWQLTIHDLADACHVSTTTIFRFCQKLGLSGFAALRAVLKHDKTNSREISREDFQATYHQVVDYIDQFDTRRLFEHMRQSDSIYLLARTELELRLAKDFQRIFFAFSKPVFILPNHLALMNSLPRIKRQILWVLHVDSGDDFPLELRTPQVMQDIFLVLLGDFKDVPLLADERLFIPKLFMQAGEQGLNHITPYTLAVEMLYLKLQLN